MKGNIVNISTCLGSCRSVVDVRWIYGACGVACRCGVPPSQFCRADPERHNIVILLSCRLCQRFLSSLHKKYTELLSMKHISKSSCIFCTTVSPAMAINCSKGIRLASWFLGLPPRKLVHRIAIWSTTAKSSGYFISKCL